MTGSLRRLGACVLLVASVSSCSSSPASSPVTSGPAAAAAFHTQDGFQPNNANQPCLLHQTEAPTSAFTGGPSATLALQLPFMAYLHANGKKAFCDGKPATDIDKKWAELYVTLTQNPADVSGITGT